MKKITDRFHEILSGNQVPGKQLKYLLAVSGGLDSVVMAHLFHVSGLKCAVAHCNFGLRGDESDGDEYFVKRTAEHYGFTFHHKKFDTAAFASDNAVSIQMAARRLRYQWFETLLEKYGYDLVAVAHHADDVAETMLINLVRGTGIAGVHGIKAINGRIIRPLINIERPELEKYARHHGLTWREDSSNAEDTYVRNKIRHHVMPVLKEINPSAAAAMLQHSHFMSGYEAIIDQYIRELNNNIVKDNFDGAVKSISIDGILTSPAPAVILYHLLKPFGFNATQCTELLKTSQSGAEFYADHFKIVRDRDAIRLFNLEFGDNKEYYISHTGEEVEMKFGKIQLRPGKTEDISKIEFLPGFRDPMHAFLDASQIKFPLKVRKWQKGDYFHPLGMKGRRLLSDYFTDNKFSTADKESVYLLLSDEKVIWVAGHRIDEHFKISHTTREFIHAKFTPIDNR